MSKVKGASFGVRFYRRGVQKVAVNAKVVIQDNAKASVMDIPEQETGFKAPSFKRLLIKGKACNAFKAVSGVGFPYVAPAYKNAKNPLKKPVQQYKEERPMAKANEQALWAAAYSGDCHMIRILVMEGVDIDARDGEGRTAINIATQYGRKDALKTLMAAKEMRYLASLGKLPDTNFFRKFQKQKTGTQ